LEFIVKGPLANGSLKKYNGCYFFVCYFFGASNYVGLLKVRVTWRMLAFKFILSPKFENMKVTFLVLLEFIVNGIFGTQGVWGWVVFRHFQLIN